MVAALAQLLEHRENVRVVVEHTPLGDEGVEAHLGARAQRVVEVPLLLSEEQPLDVDLRGGR